MFNIIFCVLVFSLAILLAALKNKDSIWTSVKKKRWEVTPDGHF